MSLEQEAVITTTANLLAEHDQALPRATLQPNNQKKLARQDILSGFHQWPVWLTLAYQDIKIRYRRSVLGPLWITLSMAITVYSMGYLYAHLFHTELQHYYPVLTAGMLSWSLLLGIVTDATDGFVTYTGLITQIKLPYTLHIHRIVARNFIVFFHNILVMLPILAIFHEYAKVNWQTLLLIPGLLTLYINGMSYGLILAMVGSRYRDIPQIIKSIMQVIFFVTPVLWEISTLPPHAQWIATYNPFYAFTQLIREPMLGRMPTLTNVGMALSITLLGLWMSFKLFVKYRSRIVYWI
jgi:ABC-type polysaccharide/polyol phosphate export permease